MYGLADLGQTILYVENFFNVPMKVEVTKGPLVREEYKYGKFTLG